MRNWLAGFPLQPGIWALLGGSTSLPRVERVSESWCVMVPPLPEKSCASWSLPSRLALIPPGREGTLQVVGDTEFYIQKSLSPMKTSPTSPSMR